YDRFVMKFNFGDGGTAGDHILNMYNPGTGPELREFWTVNGMFGNRGGDWFWGGTETGVQASYGDLATNTWILDPTGAQASAERWFVDPTYATTAGIVNPFHDPLDYGRWAGNAYYTGQGDCAFGLIGGGITDHDGDTIADDIFYDMTWFRGGHVYGGVSPQLMATIRVVSDLAPYGDMRFEYYGAGSQNVGPIMAPGAPTVGDFNSDGVIDADDIDLLCDNLGSGDLGTYDLDGDGDVDADDKVFLIENLVAWNNGVTGGIGTVVGDFNLDGIVNATDLAIMKPNFGLFGKGYADGNANCDDQIDGTDLAILDTTFAQAAAGPVPEPATLALLVLGAAGILKRRR
ncbi:MAG: PEP-CTERM sorting domain-containing protein, partial [Planctomycetota bacterium]